MRFRAQLGRDSLRDQFYLLVIFCLALPVGEHFEGLVQFRHSRRSRFENLRPLPGDPVGMILSSELPISVFDFFERGATRKAEQK